MFEMSPSFMGSAHRLSSFFCAFGSWGPFGGPLFGFEAIAATGAAQWLCEDRGRIASRTKLLEPVLAGDDDEMLGCGLGVSGVADGSGAPVTRIPLKVVGLNGIVSRCSASKRVSPAQRVKQPLLGLD